MKIYIGGDHAGYEMKEMLKVYLPGLGLGYEVVDKGPFEYHGDDDYPDFVHLVAEAVAGDESSVGIILGGSGQGEAMCANRVSGVRAAVFYGQILPKGEVNIQGIKSADSFEIIKLARMHNHANVLSLGSRFISEDEAKFATELFLSTPWDHEERNTRRVKKLN